MNQKITGDMIVAALRKHERAQKQPPIVVPPKPSTPPCPTCGETGGFHDPGAHAHARSLVPHELLVVKPEPRKKPTLLEQIARAK